jgi:threonine/homoserine/homoserine lactone efflux protein
MPIETWIAYVAAVMLLMSTPGPSQLLMISNSVANGFRRALATAAGDLTANLLQMLAAGLGLGALVLASGSAFSAVKWAGVIYLVLMGVQMIRGRGRRELTPGATVCLRRLWTQGFVTSASNPKAVVFFAALFPQFIDTGLAFWPQFAILAATYLVLDGVFLSVYGGASRWVTVQLTGPAKAWLDRVAGTFLIVAAILLGLKKVTVR